MAGSYIVAGARTPIGKMSGALASFSAADLGSIAIKAALERAGVSPNEVDHVIMGQVLMAGQGQVPSRQAAVKAGIPMSVPAINVNKVCLSGLNAIYLADQMIQAGDADVDGSHIQVLLLTLFFRHFPKLIETGNVFVARPPWFRVDAPARGKKPAAKMYALDDGELQSILDKLRKDGVREGAWSISRFKGLGEMNAEQLWETTLNPDTRRLLPVQLGTLDFAQTESLITQLMGKGEAAARRELMELHGDDIEVDI